MANTINLEIPDLGDFEDIEVIEVLVNVGDSVAAEDGLIVVETDKDGTSNWQLLSPLSHGLALLVHLYYMHDDGELIEEPVTVKASGQFKACAPHVLMISAFDAASHSRQ